MFQIPPNVGVLEEPYPRSLGPGFLAVGRRGELKTVSSIFEGWASLNVRLQPRWGFDSNPDELLSRITGRKQRAGSGYFSAIEMSVSPSGEVVLLRTDLLKKTIRLFDGSGEVKSEVKNPFIRSKSILTSTVALVSDSEAILAYGDRLPLTRKEQVESDEWNGPEELVKLDVRLVKLRLNVGDSQELCRSKIMVKQRGISIDHLFSAAVSRCGRVAYVRLFDRLVTLRFPGGGL